MGGGVSRTIGRREVQCGRKEGTTPKSAAEDTDGSLAKGKASAWWGLVLERWMRRSGVALGDVSTRSLPKLPMTINLRKLLHAILHGGGGGDLLKPAISERVQAQHH